MAKQHKLSLGALTLINLNTMIGSGVFINPPLLACLTGCLMPLAFGLIGLTVLPLILAIKYLWLDTEEGATLYHFGLRLSPFFGFIASFSYFISKCVSAGLGIHACISLLQSLFPVLAALPAIPLDCAVVLLFFSLNLFNLKFGMRIQYSFLLLKSIPILFALLAGLFLFNPSFFSLANAHPIGLPLTIPLITYSFIGFEGSCSLSNLIDQPKVTGPRAILISYGFVLALVVLFLTALYAALGPQLASLSCGYLDMYPTLISKLFSNHSWLQQILTLMMHLGIATSAAGAAYSIMYSNSWNLFTLAHYKHIFFGKQFSYLNEYGVPVNCIFLEACITITALLLTSGAIIPLQQVGTFGATLAYFCSAIAYVWVTMQKKQSLWPLPILSVLSALIILLGGLWISAGYGISQLFIFYLIVLILGSGMFWYKHRQETLLYD